MAYIVPPRFDGTPMHEERTHKVTVWGKPHEVTVYRTSQAVRIATGRYMDKTIEVKGQRAASAIKLWRSTATYRGNP